MEVMEEEELACLRAQQRAFNELRNNELAEVKRLQEQERRHSEEKVCKMTEMYRSILFIICFIWILKRYLGDDLDIWTHQTYISVTLHGRTVSYFTTEVSVKGSYREPITVSQ